MRIALLGLGLIGGSIARAVRRAEASGEIVAWTPGGRGPAAAFAAGVIDAAPATIAEAVRGADLVILAAPPLECLRLLAELRALPGLRATVTDVASTKAALVARADALDLPFVGGHPMAGRESAGFTAATADLFDGRPWVITPGLRAQPADLERVEWLAHTTGALPVRMAADVHDRAVAGISHLPLVLAAALVEAVAGSVAAPAAGWTEARLLAASGWRDMTRLARGDVTMGTGISVSNAGPLADRIRAVQAVLDGWLVDLGAGPSSGVLPGPSSGLENAEGPQPEALARRLANARAVLEEAAAVTLAPSEPSTP